MHFDGDSTPRCGRRALLLGGLGLILPACRAPFVGKGDDEVEKHRSTQGLLERAWPREAWTEARLRESEADPMDYVRRITVHHEGSPAARLMTGRKETAAVIERIRRYHVGRLGWADIGYHYVVDRAGRIWQARPVAWQGAHVKNHNEHNVGIMVLGNFNLQEPSREQLDTLPRLVRALQDRYHVPATEVRSHREFAATCCPGRSLQAAFLKMRSEGRFRT